MQKSGKVNTSLLDFSDAGMKNALEAVKELKKGGEVMVGGVVDEYGESVHIDGDEKAPACPPGL